MNGSRLITILLLFVALPLCADSKKKRTSHSPDTIPSPLSSSVVQAVEEKAVEEAEEEAEEVRETTPQRGRYNINTIPLASPDTWKGRVQRALDSLCNHPMFETSQLGFYVYDITADEDVYAVCHRQRMRPASCEKLVTAIAALHYLGGDYQLQTDLRITGDIQDGVLRGDVYVVGRMDPLLAQGDVYAMARELSSCGVERIAGSIYMDISFKDDNDYGWGWCWDDKWGPLRVLTIDGRDTFAQEFLSDLASVGIDVSVSTNVSTAVCPPYASLLSQARHSIDQILLRMMKESDNIFAESLFYHLAALGNNRNAGRKQATERINSLISSRLFLEPSAYQIADGSGLSLYNYISPQLLVCLLYYAWQNDGIRPHLYPSLPIAGSDGTLSRRMTGTAAQHNVHAKTGTVEGISSLSGYATSAEGHTLAFCIINQGIASTRQGKDFQDKVCQLLCR